MDSDKASSVSRGTVAGLEVGYRVERESSVGAPADYLAKVDDGTSLVED